ncbi:MAG: LysM peptidoglycan-binding domain-containing protein [Anaeromyxobacter sp.]
MQRLQIGNRDANGNLNQQVWDEGGQLTREIHADGGEITRSFDAFGNQVQVEDGEGHLTRYGFDKLGRNTSIKSEGVGAYTVSDTYAVSLVAEAVAGKVELTTTMEYDQAGRKIAQVNPNAERVEYTYDLRGNLIATKQPGGQISQQVYDEAGRQVGDKDANGAVATWTFDKGQLKSHKDIGGTETLFAYDKANQLVAKWSTATTERSAQNLGYAYDAAGQLIEIRDRAIGQRTVYAYNYGGKRILEQTTQGTPVSGLASGVGIQANEALPTDAVTYQNQRLGYDTLGRLATVEAMDGVSVLFEYDAVGNRIHQLTTYQAQTRRVVTDYGPVGAYGAPVIGTHTVYDTKASTKNQFFAFDAMNRQILVDGAVNGDAGDLANITKDQGHILAYDKNGNRIKDVSWGKQVVARAQGSDYAGPTTWTVFESRDGVNYEYYTYDALNRLESVKTGVFDQNWNALDPKYALKLDERLYDRASRVVKVGTTDDVDPGYRAKLVENDAEANGARNRVTRYDQNGRVKSMKVMNANGAFDNETRYEAKVSGVWTDGAGYDDAGNVKNYTSKGSSGAKQVFEVSFAKLEGYKEAKVVAYREDDAGNKGTTTETYDGNGFLIGLDDSSKNAYDRSFINDADGHVLQKLQEERILRELVVNGNVMGVYGEGTDPHKQNKDNGDPNYVAQGNFGLTYQPITNAYPSAAVGQYPVRAGDTLKSIAQSSYGDSSLWYLIADANGLRTDADLRVGQTLVIPNGAIGSKNTADTYQPYDQSRIVGSTTPNIPMPANKGCGVIGMIMVIVVTAVAAYFTAGAALAVLGPAMGALSVGFAASTVAGAIGAAVGSAAGQLVGMAMGMQESFSWKQVAVAAATSVLGAGSGAISGIQNTALRVGAAALNAAAQNAASQGIAILVGTQDKFSWKSMAMASLSAGLNTAADKVFYGGALSNLGHSDNSLIRGNQLVGAGETVLRETTVFPSPRLTVLGSVNPERIG